MTRQKALLSFIAEQQKIQNSNPLKKNPQLDLLSMKVVDWCLGDGGGWFTWIALIFLFGEFYIYYIP